MADNRRKLLRLFSAFALCAAVFPLLSYGESRPPAAKMSDTSLIIGTYLFDFEALNEENQALAEKNAQDTGQTRVYYKSEYNSGVWYDITNAESVNDIILSNSNIVDDKVIDAIEVTYYFKADGSIVDFKEGKTITAQDIESAVSPGNLSELSSLENQLEITDGLVDASKDGDEDKHKSYLAEQSAIKEVLAPINDDVTKDLTEKLNALDKLGKEVDSAGRERIAADKVTLRGKLDKYCSQVAYARLEEQINALTNRDKAEHAELISMFTDCQSALNENISELESGIGSDKTTPSAKLQQELSDKMIDSAVSGSTDAAKKALDDMLVLDAIVNNTPVDAQKAAEMSDRLMQTAMDGIEELVGSVLDGTNDYYSDENTQSAAEIAGELNVAVKEAESSAKSAAAYLSDSAGSAEYNKLVSDRLGKLGELLEELSKESGSGGSDGSEGDSLLDAINSTLADCTDEILTAAENALALGDTSLAAEQQKINNILSDIDSAYEKYIEALSGGDTEKAGSLEEKLEKLRDKLSKARADTLDKVGDKLAGLFSDKSAALGNEPQDGAAKDNERRTLAEISAMLPLLSDTDAALIGELCDAAAEFDDACESGVVSDVGEAYNALRDSLANTPEDFLDNKDKAAALAYAAEKLADSEIDSDVLSEQLKDDIGAALDGTLSPSGGIGGGGDSSPEDAPPGTIDELSQYKLIIAPYEVYSNDMSVEKDNAVFIDAKKLSEIVPMQYIETDEVIVMKGEDALIEFSLGSTTAYVDDKMFALAKAPFEQGGSVYVPAELIARGLGMTQTKENGTLILR